MGRGELRPTGTETGHQSQPGRRMDTGSPDRPGLQRGGDCGNRQGRQRNTGNPRQEWRGLPGGSGERRGLLGLGLVAGRDWRSLGF